jgi:hypothetical protein
LLANPLARAPLPIGERAVELGALGGTRTPNLLIRRSGQVVQDRPSWTVRWADIPQLSALDGRCPAAWQQCRQQSLQDDIAVAGVLVVCGYVQAEVSWVVAEEYAKPSGTVFSDAAADDHAVERDWLAVVLL